MARLIIVGDLHGCCEELESLLELLQPAAGDCIHFVGDLVDRGPDSAGAVKQVRRLLEQFPSSICLAGNHEEKLLRRRDQGKPLPDWASQLDDSDWFFLDALPLVHRLPDYGAIMVHGGFFPAFFDRYGALGEVASDWRRARSKKADRMRRFLRIRRINVAGNMVALNQIQEGHRHWSELYEGQEGFVFHGHDARPDLAAPEVSGRTMNLDTGCCFGGALSAAVLRPGMRPEDAETVSVSAKRAYARFLSPKT